MTRQARTDAALTRTGAALTRHFWNLPPIFLDYILHSNHLQEVSVAASPVASMRAGPASMRVSTAPYDRDFISRYTKVRNIKSNLNPDLHLNKRKSASGTVGSNIGVGHPCGETVLLQMIQALHMVQKAIEKSQGLAQPVVLVLFIYALILAADYDRIKSMLLRPARTLDNNRKSNRQGTALTRNSGTTLAKLEKVWEDGLLGLELASLADQNFQTGNWKRVCATFR
ncbi:hypothetical protein C8R44DRAFT_730391 [Mycena epipterygia]|nr:hypothetical protein C8R44DRAFT_730391 [Mycena epipterygia]